MLFILYPAGVNWFHDAVARNVHDELLIEGISCRLVTPRELVSIEIETFGGIADVLIVNAIECAHGLAGPFATAVQIDSAVDRLVQRIRPFRRRILLNIDGVHTTWFAEQVSRLRRSLTDIFDLCMVPQVDQPTLAGCRYTWIQESFTRAELEQLGQLEPHENDRPLVWSMIAHATRDRVEMADQLVRRLSPAGFVFMPSLRPFPAEGSRNLSPGALDRVLRKSRYYIWTSHHRLPYHEGLRSLHAVRNGAVPVKIDPLFAFAFREVPWVYESVTAFQTAIDDLGPGALYQNALDFIRARGTLGHHLAGALLADDSPGNSAVEPVGRIGIESGAR